MKLATERQLQARLASDPSWAAHPVGRLARLMLDNGVPVMAAANYLGVAGVVLRRWLYGYGGRSYLPGGRAERKKELIAKIELLCRIIDAAYKRDRLKAPWLENFKRTESDLPCSHVIQYEPSGTGGVAP